MPWRAITAGRASTMLWSGGLAPFEDAERAKQQAQANIDAWWPCIEQGAEQSS